MQILFVTREVPLTAYESDQYLLFTSWSFQENGFETEALKTCDDDFKASVSKSFSLKLHEVNNKYFNLFSTFRIPEKIQLANMCSFNIDAFVQWAKSCIFTRMLVLLTHLNPDSFFFVVFRDIA